MVVHPAILVSGLVAIALALPAAVSITVEGDARVIVSDGLPDHETGAFPNAGNPNRIAAQAYRYRLPLEPKPAPAPIVCPLGVFGIALNGVLFDPGAAEWWRGDPRGGWQYDALGGAIDLGLDAQQAHVQPTGAYHYHGIPTALAERLRTGKPGSMVLIGWAADGYPIYLRQGHRDPMDPSSPLVDLRSSYRLKVGPRQGGPGGKPDGTFVQDWEFVAGLGDLDACNGRSGVTPEFPEGTYHYVLTDVFPTVPRCWHGLPDPSFLLRGRPPPHGHSPPGRRLPP